MDNNAVIEHTHLDLPPDTVNYLGVIHIRELPVEWDEETWRYYWLPERYKSGSNKGQIKRPARLSEQEKQRFTVRKVKNLITTAGRSQILTFVGNPSSNTKSFSQYFAVGTFPINTVQPGDTAVNGELYRSVPATYAVTGNTVDISTFYGTATGNGTLTNCGLFGVNATSSAGSGSLMTHALLNGYVKDSGHTVTFDYLISLA